MARIADLLAAGPTYSFEFFPPKTDEGDRNLRDALNLLEPLGPSFVSVTYGAGGSTRERTRQVVLDLLERTTMTPMAHLTGVAHTRDELRTIIGRYAEAGVENLLALRGDPPQDADDPSEVPGDIPGEMGYAVDLVHLAREAGGDDLCVGVAAHPEGHPLSPSRGEDRRHLAAKLEAADFAITQFFFDASDYLAMRDDLAALGCDKPVIPGIMPVTNARQIQRMAQMSGAAFPSDLAERLLAVEDDLDAVAAIGVEIATELCTKLLEEGAPGLHFYTLNRSPATREIYTNLGLAGA